jgi:predicted nuclease of predicted toxin-antitoxin system
MTASEVAIQSICWPRITALSVPPSKKQSDKPKSSAPRKDATLFLDRNLGRKVVADVLREAGFPVVAHDEKFAPDTPDEEWLDVVGKQGWIVISRDRQIRRRPNELDALRRAKVRAVFVTGGNLSGHALAELVRSSGAKIQNHALSASAPVIFSLTKDGSLKKIKL